MSRRLPDWDCPQCGLTKIFGSKPECVKCHTKNPNWPSGHGSAAPAPAPAGGRPHLPDWNCGKCQMKIFGSKDTCAKCGKRNPGLPPVVAPVPVPAPAPAPAALPAANSAGGRPADWQCPNCPNFLVFGSKPTCPKCAARNPALAPPPALAAAPAKVTTLYSV